MHRAISVLAMHAVSVPWAWQTNTKPFTRRDGHLQPHTPRLAPAYCNYGAVALRTQPVALVQPKIPHLKDMVYT